MKKYKTEIINHIYWKTENTIQIRNVHKWFRKKHPASSDAYLKKQIEELVSEGYLEYQPEPIFFIEPVAMIDDKTGVSTPIPDNQRKLEPSSSPTHLALTNMGFEYAEENKKLSAKIFRAFLLKTGISILLSHLLVVFLLMP